ncbi:MAG TPA: serine/threonine-protein kinase [Terracidiphilus sp.]
MPETGERVGDYEILAALGAGGMGRVYKVRNVISNREEAMKILLPDFASDPELAARFMVEIRTLASLEHPGITQLRTAFQFQDQFVMVMEFVEGATLEKTATQSRIPLHRTLDYSNQILAALGYAHRRGVTHRDIKPANIMITAHGLVKLMDFGIAKSANDVQLTRPGTTLGSVYYMSPEQVRGGDIDGRSDIYSFGVMLYELLTGRKPFVADSSFSLLNAHLNEIPTPPLEINPALSRELNDVVLRAMAKRPEDRFQTVEEFRDAITPRRKPAPAPAPPPEPTPDPQNNAVPSEPTPDRQNNSPAPPSPPPARTRRSLWIRIGAAIAILALVAVAALLPRILALRAGHKQAVSPVGTPASSPATPAPSPPAAPQAEGGRTDDLPTPPPDHESASSPSTTKSKKSKNPAPETAAETVPGKSSPTGTPASLVVPAVPSEEVREAQERWTKLDARASTAFSGVQQLRSQQQAQGLVIRGDILEAMNRARQCLSQAHTALGSRDLPSATAYMNGADVEIARLEKFLGR